MLKIRTYITFCAMLLVSIFIAGIAIAGPRLTKTQENCLHAWDGAVENLKADKWGMLSVDEVKSMIDAGVPFTLLDVRMAKDREKDGAIAGSIHIPITDLADKIAQLPDDLNAPIVIHCKSDWTGVMAMTMLRQLGYVNTKNMKGGFSAWQKAGYPIVKTP